MCCDLHHVLHLLQNVFSLINWSLLYDLHWPFSPAERMIVHCFNVLTYRLIHLNSYSF